jgi:hypothetical protein
MTYLPRLLTRKPLCAALATATLSVAGCLVLPAPAFAQASTPSAAPSTAPAQAKPNDDTRKTDKPKAGEPGSPTTMDAVVVTSYRQSIDQNVQDKREANSIVEVINAQNIAQFPPRTSPMRWHTCPAWSSAANPAKARR